MFLFRFQSTRNSHVSYAPASRLHTHHAQNSASFWVFLWVHRERMPPMPPHSSQKIKHRTHRDYVYFVNSYRRQVIEYVTSTAAVSTRMQRSYEKQILPLRSTLYRVERLSCTYVGDANPPATVVTTALFIQVLSQYPMRVVLMFSSSLAKFAYFTPGGPDFYANLLQIRTSTAVVL